MLLDLTSELYSWIRGGLLILSIYHFAIFVLNKRKLYLYYSLYSFSLFIYFFSHVCPEPYQWIYRYINFSIQFIAFAFYVLFGRDLLQSKKHIPDWDVLLVIEYRLFFVLSLAFISVEIFFSYEHQEKLFLTLAPIFTVFALLTYVVLTKIKGRHVTFFIVGSLAYIILANCSLLLPLIVGDEFFIKIKVDPMFFTYVGAIIELIMFALIVAFRVTQLENQKDRFSADLNDKIKEMSELKMTALQSRMDPHFLYNSLNSINNFVLQNDVEKASDYITKFSRLIREILKKSSNKTIPLSEELGILGLYVRLEQMRMEDGFDYVVTVDDNINLENIMVPPLFMQPYIENAIWHGFATKTDNKKINLTVYDEDDKIRCEIIDNGIGIEKSKQLNKSSSRHRKSFGLQTSEDRIKLLHEHQKVYVIIEDISSNGKTGTKVTIKFPKII
ncbi:MAG: histidine kinase [Flavobacteriaceae bacterium]|nr:histidine kinase [Flavobacteriaceae bacterium]